MIRPFLAAPLAGWCLLLLACSPSGGDVEADGSRAVERGAPAAPLPGDSVYQLALPLVDQSGRRTDWRTRRGRPQIVSMFYTSCQYICPLIIDSALAVEKGLTPAQKSELGVLVISMDPARDTPDALATVAERRGLPLDRWTLAAPQPDDVRTVAGVLGIRYRALEDGEFNHTSALVLLDRDGRIITRTEKMGLQADPGFLDAVRRTLAAETPPGT